MKLLVVALLAAGLAVLLTVTLLVGYRSDQRAIGWFPGTGIAGKVDVIGAVPPYISIASRDTQAKLGVEVLSDGTFVAPLPPGIYDLQLPGDGRSVRLVIPEGECLDLVLDFRFPFVVLKVPHEGWPLPALAG